MVVGGGGNGSELLFGVLLFSGGCGNLLVCLVLCVFVIVSVLLKFLVVVGSVCWCLVVFVWLFGCLVVVGLCGVG